MPNHKQQSAHPHQSPHRQQQTPTTGQASAHSDPRPHGIVVIGPPHRGAMDWQFLAHYERLEKPPLWTSIAVGGTHVDQARNTIVRRALAAAPDVSHILMIDDDIVAEPRSLLQLLAHDVPVVGGLYFERLPPHRPVVYKRGSGHASGYVPFEDFAPSGLQEVDGIGGGFLLVRREVYEAIDPPWFANQFPVSEDVYFCAKAQQAGFRILLDAGMRLGHLTTAIVTEADYRRYLMEPDEEGSKEHV